MRPETIAALKQAVKEAREAVHDLVELVNGHPTNTPNEVRMKTVKEAVDHVEELADFR